MDGIMVTASSSPPGTGMAASCGSASALQRNPGGSAGSWGAWKVPSPLPGRMLNVPNYADHQGAPVRVGTIAENVFATARSSLPSPLKSPATALVGI